MWISGLAGWPAQALAQSDLIGAEAFDVDVDLRASVTGGEEGWLDGGFGKLREGGDGGDPQVRAGIAAADVAWKPQLGFNFSGLVSFAWQPDIPGDDVGLSEAYLKYRSDPAPTRVSARAGVFWPPVSQEHSGSNWAVTDSITPSAANSWIGEEVKVLGLEGNVEHRFGEHEVALTAAVFLHNDMSGTLLTYRGWALHDVRATTNADLPLPPLSASTAPYQDTVTSPFWEVDDRVGFYARADWTPPLPVTFNALYYDNRGDRESSRPSGAAYQTSWRTRFWNVGAMASLDDRTVAKAQLMWGNTLVGPDTPFGIPADVDFATAYLLVTRQLGPGRLSVRGDWFETHDNSFVATDNNDEHGWAAMLAYMAPLHDYADLGIEVLHVSSDRPGRQLYGGIAADQDQTIVQSSLRIGL
ncbi:MAG TPA: hypothetical protein VEB68_13850 [Croceibacterium sp.]|nr:hypothetical protein [Croceibacterium sp.]